MGVRCNQPDTSPQLAHDSSDKPVPCAAYIHWFQFLYFFSSFWGQWGPNATTWLLPAELFPTETRAMSHGIAAATGAQMLDDSKRPCVASACKPWSRPGVTSASYKW